jgi:hypothetical protein
VDLHRVRFDELAIAAAEVVEVFVGARTRRRRARGDGPLARGRATPSGLLDAVRCSSGGEKTAAFCLRIQKRAPEMSMQEPGKASPNGKARVTSAFERHRETRTVAY